MWLGNFLVTVLCWDLDAAENICCWWGWNLELLEVLSLMDNEICLVVRSLHSVKIPWNLLGYSPSLCWTLYLLWNPITSWRWNLESPCQSWLLKHLSKELIDFCCMTSIFFIYQAQTANFGKGIILRSLKRCFLWTHNNHLNNDA